MSKKVVAIGVGNCGSQISALASKKYPDLFDSIYINTSDSDLQMISEKGLKFKIGEKEAIEGSGKNRTKMKEYLKNDIQNIIGNDKFQKMVVEKKYAFIIASAAGGTGSGAAPVLMEIMRQMFPETNFILVCVLPQIGASLLEQSNTIEFLDELYQVLGNNTTYMMYDNESVVGFPPTMGLTMVNESIVEDIRILTGVDNKPTPFESIDDADMESIITTPGRLMVVRITKGLTEKSMEDNNLDEIIIKAIKKSTNAETDRNKKVVRWGIITFFTEQVNNLYSPDFDELLNFIGTPIERFNHNAVNDGKEDKNYLYVIASGLSPINDRVTKITDRIKELQESIKSDANRYILNGNKEFDELKKTRNKERKTFNPEVIDATDIFKKFM